MLPPENQLKKKKEIEKVFKLGKGLKESFLYIKAKMNKLENSRFCFIVSKKVAKKAVVRNKIKRRLREITRKNLLKIRKGLDIIIIALPGAEKENYKVLEEKINKLFKKIK